MLEHILTEFIVVYLCDVITSIQSSETGEVADIPMTIDGILWDYDQDFLMLGDESKISITLVNRSKVARIDVMNKAMEAMDDPLKPDRGAMS